MERGQGVDDGGDADGGVIAVDCGAEAEEVGDGAGVFLEVLGGGEVGALGVGADLDAGAGGAGGYDGVVGLAK